MTIASDETIMHPRPQLTRRHWVDLCGTWGFAHDDQERGLHDGWMNDATVFTRSITVPFPPESPASGVGETGYHPVVWYRRTFERPSGHSDQRLMLHCGAVDYCAQVWVNGQLVATHEGGMTPFSADITAALHKTGEQVLVIRAEDDPHDLAQPRGKQDWEEKPHTIWYYRTTGIWQPVWLEPVAPLHIQSLRWTPHVSEGRLSLQVRLNQRAGAEQRLHVHLRLRDTVLANDVYTIAAGEQSLTREISYSQTAQSIPNEKLLWAPHHPNLLEATLTLSASDGTMQDEVGSYVGLRSVGFAQGRFLLNGAPYYLRLALEQGYWPQSHLTPPSVEAMRREIELTHELGFNGLRIHQKVEDPRFLALCDQMGLIIWGEMANAYRYTQESVQRLVREWLEVVERDYNHPCIVSWVPINESWGVPQLRSSAAQRHFIQSMYHLTKALDPERLAQDNEGWEHIVSDIHGLHDYSFEPQILRDRYGDAEALERSFKTEPSNHAMALPGYQRQGEPVMLTEFGGLSYRPEAGERWFGYGTVTNKDEYLERLRGLVEAVLDSSVLSGFCYTQLTDTGQETNGLLTENREHKLDPAAVRAIFSRASVAVPGDHTALLWRKQGVTINQGERPAVAETYVEK